MPGERIEASLTLFYLDPPYIPETRKSGKYRHEMTAEDHQELVEILLSIQGKVVLSGYNHPIYKPLEDDGKRVGETPKNGVNGGNQSR
ncbi:MAG: DNA adenine methylase [Armatimonadota bacterium]